VSLFLSYPTSSAHLNVVGKFSAGQERFRALARGYYRGAAGALIVYDVTKAQTFDNVESWLRELRDFTDGELTVMLVGNKNDLVSHREVSTETARKFCEENELMYIETSALMGENIKEAFQQLVGCKLISFIYSSALKLTFLSAIYQQNSRKMVNEAGNVSEEKPTPPESTKTLVLEPTRENPTKPNGPCTC